MGRKNNKKTLENERPIQEEKTKSQDTPKKEINPNAEYRDILVKTYVSKSELDQIKDFIKTKTKNEEFNRKKYG